MNSDLVYALAGVVLFATGAAGFFGLSHLLRRLIALNVAASGVFLALVGLAQRGGQPDPVAHALVLTGIVIAVAATALGLALMRQLATATGRATLDAPALGRTARQTARQKI